jgi:hypothetical protein
MNLCSSGHDEICYEGRTCPFCVYIKESEEGLGAIQDKLTEAKDSLADAEARISELEEEPLITAANNALRAVEKVK